LSQDHRAHGFKISRSSFTLVVAAKPSFGQDVTVHRAQQFLLGCAGLQVRGLLAIACVAALCHQLASPVPGLGIALPVFVPAIASAAVALLLSLRRAAPLAYIGGSLGTLIGADLLNLGRVQGLGAPLVSIGGAGTFDGIFLTGVLAVLIASVSR